MKKIFALIMIGVLATGTLAGCGKAEYTQNGSGVSKEEAKAKTFEGVTEIMLSDTGVTVDGEKATSDKDAAVYVANDIVFYLTGQDFTYGEGSTADEHTQEEADAHTVVHITKPGTYAVTGILSAGQIAVDLGEDAEEDPKAVVNLILNNTDITCTVAPGVIFYNVYECSAADKENPKKDVDTSAAGANVIIADGTYNTINGSYVARIYKSYTLNEDGTEVVDSKKLHKYDGAFYSKMSMNINGDEHGTGVLEINAENEGMDSELHLTINGGNIKINSGDDGINTNEDGVSVTTVNGGSVVLNVNGSTGEGDGIDSNGWLVINGGSVIGYACSSSGDAGIDSDMGIHINGGSVLATGNMLDRISESAQNYAVFNFSSRQKGGEDVVLKDVDKQVVGRWATVNDYSYLIIAGDFLEEGTYSLWIGDKQYQGMTGNQGMGFGGMGFGGMGFDGNDGGMNFEGKEFDGKESDGKESDGKDFEGNQFEGEVPEWEGFEGMTPGEMPELPEGMEMPEGGFQGGEMPEGMELPEGMDVPEGLELPEGAEMPENGFREGGKGGFGGRGQMGQNGDRDQMSIANMELTAEFEITAGGNYFTMVSSMEE